MKEESSTSLDRLKKTKPEDESKKCYRSTDNPFMLELSSGPEEFFCALPYSDIKKIDFGRHTENRIEIEFWKHLVVVSGKRLQDLAVEIARHKILRLIHGPAEQEGNAWIERIEVVLLENDSPSADEEAETADE